MIPAELQTELDRLAEILAPEFAPPYWVDSADAPAALNNSCCWGFTGPEADLALCNHLTSAGQWTGRRPAIVLDLQAIARDLDHRAYFNDELRRLAMIGYGVAVGVHELSHTADLGISAEEPTPAYCGKVEHTLASWIEIAPRQSAPHYPPWDFGHGPSWLRLLAHATHRAAAAGFTFPFDAIWQRPNMTCPLLHTATATCGDELTALADVPLSRINDHTPTADYRGLWECKTTRWRESRPADDPAADRHVREALSFFEGYQC